MMAQPWLSVSPSLAHRTCWQPLLFANSRPRGASAGAHGQWFEWLTSDDERDFGVSIPLLPPGVLPDSVQLPTGPAPWSRHGAALRDTWLSALISPVGMGSCGSPGWAGVPRWAGQPRLPAL